MKIPTDPKIVDALRVSSRIRGKENWAVFAYRVDGTVPCIATAIHAGGRVREELISLMAMDTAQRYYEEDPATDTMIEKSGFGGMGSRFQKRIRPESTARGGRSRKSRTILGKRRIQQPAGRRNGSKKSGQAQGILRFHGQLGKGDDQSVRRIGGV